MSTKVIIIGAGIAGLSAANELLKQGIDVLVLEGSDRIGGRIFTTTDSFSVPIDLGASWIHKTTGNPLDALASQLGLSLDLNTNPNLTSENSFEIYDADGKQIDPEWEKAVRQKFDLLLEQGRQITAELPHDISLQEMFDLAKDLEDKPETPHEIRFLEWLKSGIEGWESASLKRISARNHFLEQDKDTLSGADAFVVGGYKTFIDYLAKPLVAQGRIKLNEKVNKILYSPTGVLVRTQNDVYFGARCVCTVPLGILKAGAIDFYPPLPDEKLDSIHRLGFGVMNKIILEYEKPFWNPQCDGLAYISNEHGDFRFFLNLMPIVKRPILVGFVAGDFARKMESWDDAKILSKVTRVLSTTCPGAHVPRPTRHVITRWASHAFSRGSYSYLAVGSSLQDIANLAAPLEALRFAGEATWEFPGYAHGAYLSGLREAQRIGKEIRPSSNVTNNVIVPSSEVADNVNNNANAVLSSGGMREEENQEELETVSNHNTQLLSSKKYPTNSSSSVSAVPKGTSRPAMEMRGSTGRVNSSGVPAKSLLKAKL